MSLETEEITSDPIDAYEDLCRRIEAGELPTDSCCLAILGDARKTQRDLRADVQAIRDEKNELAAYAQAQYTSLIAAIQADGGPDAETVLAISDAAGKDVSDLADDLKKAELAAAKSAYATMLSDAILLGDLPTRGHVQDVCEAAGKSIEDYELDYLRATSPTT